MLIGATDARLTIICHIRVVHSDSSLISAIRFTERSFRLQIASAMIDRKLINYRASNLAIVRNRSSHTHLSIERWNLNSARSWPIYLASCRRSSPSRIISTIPSSTSWSTTFLLVRWLYPIWCRAVSIMIFCNYKCDKWMADLLRRTRRDFSLHIRRNWPNDSFSAFLITNSFDCNSFMRSISIIVSCQCI